MKKVLILYTSIGLGHKSIAENIGFYLAEAGYEVQLHDAHKVQGGLLASWGAKVYHLLIRKLPFVWDWLHSTEWFITLTLPYRTKVAGKNYKNILEVINKFQPDAVMSVHNTASAIVSYLKQEGLYKGSFGIAFSDYYFHRFWLFDNCDFYLANIEEQKAQMIKLGVKPERIFVCGITLQPKMNVNIDAVKAKLGISQGNKVILFSSGSQAIGLDDSLLAELANLKNTNVLVVCGKYGELAQTLKMKFKGSNILPFGYYHPMDELYAVSDIYISKPGGLSVAEALLWQLPVLIFYILPGGEPFNYKYLVQNNLVLSKTSDQFKTILKELEGGDFKKQLAKNGELIKLLGDGSRVVEAVKWALNRPK